MTWDDSGRRRYTPFVMRPHGTGSAALALAATVLAFGFVSAGGCVESRGRYDPIENAIDSDCIFDAASMRVHPLTRIVWSNTEDGPSPVLDAHIELLDSWGDTSKSLGVFRMELRRAGLHGGDLTDAVRWEVDLRDPSTNSTRFDRVTQTYLLRLLDLPAWVSKDRSAMLSATFVRADGFSMTSTLRIDTGAE